MDPSWAARVIATQFLGRDPNESELAWAERVIRTVLPRDKDQTPVRLVTLKDWPRTEPTPRPK